MVGKQHPDAPGLDRSGSPTRPAAQSRLPAPSAEPGRKRPLPSYEGRDEAPPDAGEVLVWIPRILLYPVHLTLEYLVRWPIVGALTLIEKYHVLENIERIFTFRDGKAGYYPTAFIDFGLSPSVGLFAFYDDLITEGDSLSLQAGFWTDNWHHVALHSRSLMLRDNSAGLSLTAEYTNRPDEPYFGVGAGTVQDDESFYRWRRFDGEVAIDAELGGLNRFDFSLFFRDAKIQGGQAPSIDRLRDDDALDRIRALGSLSYQLLSARMSLALDTREDQRDFSQGSGFRAEGFGAFKIDPSNTDLSFVRFGGEAAGFWDFSDLNHVLSMRLYAEGIETIGEAEIPFTELILLGGNERMRGFLLGRFRGESAVVATIDYRYPVWSLLDANLFLSFGGAFDKRFKDFRWDRLFMSWGLGLRTSYSRDSSFDLIVAFGSNEAKQWNDGGGFEVDHIRFVFGVNHGF